MLKNHFSIEKSASTNKHIDRCEQKKEAFCDTSLNPYPTPFGFEEVGGVECLET